MNTHKKILGIRRLSLSWIFTIACYYGLRLFGVIYKEGETRLKFYLHLIQCNGRIISHNAKYITCKYTVLEKDVIIHLRNFPSSDPRVFEQIFVNQQYKRIAELLTARGERLTMVDGGANIGLASVYFKLFFNDLKVIAIEPDQDNFKLLKRNFESNRISTKGCLNMALWGRAVMLATRLDFRDGKSWSVSVEESNKSDAVLWGVTLQELFHKYKLETLDLLKVDIEGSEKYLFGNAVDVQDILKKIRCVVMEIHDEVVDRHAIEQQLLDAGGTVTQDGELTISLNNKIFHYGG